MDRKPQAPGYVRWITKTLEDAGFETWAVGGAVRNALLGLPAGDWDMATRAPPEVVQRLFSRTVPVGIEHGTVGVLTRDGVLVEVTTFRRDVETTGRHAVVEFADTLREDLARRDFTINAVAWHPTRHEFQDPFHGRTDLEARLLRTVGNPADRFAEDYLRVLRALRFSGRFDCRIHGDTWKALCDSTGRLGTLSPERVREELVKVLTQDPKPSGAMGLYTTSGCLGALFPELSDVVGCRRPGRDEELWDHSLRLADVLSALRPLLRLAALLHGIGIPDGDADSREPMDLRGRDRAAALMIRYRFSNAEIREVTELIRIGLEPPVELSSQPGFRQWLYRAEPHRLPSLGRIWLAKARLDRLRWGRDPGQVLHLLRRLRGEVLGGAPLRLEDLALNGRDLIALGLRPSPRFGEILDHLMARVLEDPGLNTKDRLLELVDVTGHGLEEDR